MVISARLVLDKSKVQKKKEKNRRDFVSYYQNVSGVMCGTREMRVRVCRFARDASVDF